MTSGAAGHEPSSPGAHEFETVASRVVYNGAILTLRLDEVVMPGGRPAQREVVEHHGAVAVVALDAADRVVLIRQYRHPLGTRLLELPAGLLDVPGEDPHTAAQRELAEETALAARDWSVLVDVALSPGFTDEALRVFLATGLDTTDRPEPEHEEADLEVVYLPVADAVSAALAGEIVNATAVAGILALAAARATGEPMRPADAPWPGQPTALLARQAAESADED